MIHIKFFIRGVFRMFCLLCCIAIVAYLGISIMVFPVVLANLFLTTGQDTWLLYFVPGSLVAALTLTYQIGKHES